MKGSDGMHIYIEIHTIGPAGRSLRRGEFPVNVRKYKEDPDMEAARISYDFILNVRREKGQDSAIEKVIYEAKDITDLVKKLDEK